MLLLRHAVSPRGVPAAPAVPRPTVLGLALVAAHACPNHSHTQRRWTARAARPRTAPTATDARRRHRYARRDRCPKGWRRAVPRGPAVARVDPLAAAASITS